MKFEFGQFCARLVLIFFYFYILGLHRSFIKSDWSRPRVTQDEGVRGAYRHVRVDPNGGLADGHPTILLSNA
jgi:hypothetical protein